MSNATPSPSPHKLHEVPLPSFLARLAQDPGEVTWTCPTCGEIAPRAVTWGPITRYARGRCVCQAEAERRRREEEERRAWNEGQVRQTYGWLEGSLFRGSPLVEKTFESFQVERQPGAYQLARTWAENPAGTLILYGDYGTGKTHLLAAIANATREERRVSCLFATSPELFVALQARIAAHEDHTVLIGRAARTPLLILDDIDKAKHTDFREEMYFAIIDKRVQQGLPIALSTNRLDDLASFVGGAVASRLKVGQIAVPMYGEDFRALL